MNKLLYILLLVLIKSSFAFGQNTVGLLSYEPTESYEGYNLIFPQNQSTVYLLNNCGEIVHSWDDEANFRPGNIAYLLEDGRLLKGKRDALVTDDAIWAGGGGEFIELRDWDNTLLWEFELNDSLARLHHDFAITEEGNILMIAWELKTQEEAIEAGRDPNTLSQGELWADYIFEVDPTKDEIVWEWHVWDHLIQDYDSTKNNYGVVADHPELVDINWDTNDGKADWMHGNALDYNPETKQVLISVPTFHEFWIIDKTTTSDEAATNRGGLSGLGGDLMYRWGNPAAYKKGTEEDQKLFYPHDIHWIDDFVEFTLPNYNHIAIFNNRVGANYSTANILAPAWNMYGWDYFSEDGVFEPSQFEKVFMHPDTFSLYSTGLSSIQILPNGNTLICSGRFGYSFEMTPSNEIVWEYKTPLRMGQPASQGDTLAINNNLTFRLKRYPTDFAAFEGKDLSSKGYIELNPDTTFCNNTMTSINEFSLPSKMKVFPNPTSDLLTIEWDNMMKADLEIYNQLGHRVAAYPKCSGGRKYIMTDSWTPGIYFATINRAYSAKFIVLD